MKGIPKITLEPANMVCPKCGNPNYMRHLIGANVGELDMKCINCNSYFNFDELYKQKIAEVLKPKSQTNYDRIRSMTDEELARFISSLTDCPYCVIDERKTCPKCISDTSACVKALLEWLKQEANE